MAMLAMRGQKQNAGGGSQKKRALYVRSPQGHAQPMPAGLTLLNSGLSPQNASVVSGRFSETPANNGGGVLPSVILGQQSPQEKKKPKKRNLRVRPQTAKLAPSELVFNKFWPYSKKRPRHRLWLMRFIGILQSKATKTGEPAKDAKPKYRVSSAGASGSPKIVITRMDGRKFDRESEENREWQSPDERRVNRHRPMSHAGVRNQKPMEEQQYLHRSEFADSRDAPIDDGQYSRSHKSTPVQMRDEK